MKGIKATAAGNCPAIECYFLFPAPKKKVTKEKELKPYRAVSAWSQAETGPGNCLQNGITNYIAGCGMPDIRD